MPRNSRSGSEPGEEMATFLPLRSASVLISALARTTCGTPGQVQPTILTPVPRAPATIDSAAPMSTLSISPAIKRLHQRGAGLDLENFDLQAVLGAEAAFVDHGDEAGIALGFENAVLPDFLLRARGRETADDE